MRSNGVAEKFCTGDAEPFAKFRAWAGTVPLTLRNPLYHWTHLELKRYFGIDELLDERSAKSIWDRSEATFRTGELSTHKILRKFSVRAVCTSDDPCDHLSHHQSIAASQLGVRVYPPFRPDKALLVQQPDAFNPWTARLERASNISVTTLQNFPDALKQRHDFFHRHSGRLSDHGLPHCYATPA